MELATSSPYPCYPRDRRPGLLAQTYRPSPVGFSQDRTTFPGWGPKL